MSKKPLPHGDTTKVGINDEWLSPPEMVKALGPFDLDPASPVIRPWDTALQHYNIHDDGLFMPWFGRVWLNPPYGKYLKDWLNKMALHNNGISLLPGRTENLAFHNFVFPHASSIMFLKGRVKFFDVQGKISEGDGGYPSVLVSYGKENMEKLGDSGLKGKHLLVNYTPIIVVTFDRTWKSVVSMSLEKLSGTASLDAIYNMVEAVAPEKVRNNEHHKAKVRQVLQTYFTKIKRGQYSLN